MNRKGPKISAIEFSQTKPRLAGHGKLPEAMVDAGGALGLCQLTNRLNRLSPMIDRLDTFVGRDYLPREFCRWRALRSRLFSLGESAPGLLGTVARPFPTRCEE